VKAQQPDGVFYVIYSMGSIKRACIFFLSILILLASLCVFSAAPVMAEDSLFSTAAINTSTWVISEEQAIEIASGYLPAQVSENAVVYIGMSTVTEPGTDTRYIWVVAFSGVTISNQELGWQSGPDTLIDDSAEYSDSFQINIDAQTGKPLFKLALRPGIHFAIPSADGLPSTIAINTSTWPISEEQAVEIASGCMPPCALLNSDITVKYGLRINSHYIWQVSFDGFSATRDDFIAFGWVEDDNTLLPDFPEYHVATINVDSETGSILLKSVSIVRLGPIPNVTKIIEAPFFSSPYWRILGGVGLFFVVVIGYLAVRMWFMNRAER
jgi:hypothetical protein